MDGKQITLIALRVLGILCACVVLGTSINVHSYVNAVLTLCHAGGLGDVCDDFGLQTMLEFGAFTGAWGLLVTLAGLASIFLTAIPWIAICIGDALAALFYIADGIALAVWDGKHEARFKNVLTGVPGSSGKLTEGQADDAFMFIGGITAIVLIVLGFMWQRGRKY